MIITLLLFVLFLFGFTTFSTAEDSIEVGLLPSENTVTKGNDFTITVYIDTSEEIGGWEINLLTFSQEIVQLTKVTPGSNWTEFFDNGTINNNDGNITGIQTWRSVEPYPDNYHTACTLTFNAIKPGLCTFELVFFQVTNSSFADLTFTSKNTSVTVKDSDQDPPSDGNPTIDDEIKGHLEDENDDGTYDNFYNNETGNKTKTELYDEDTYLIDSNGDGIWDYLYDIDANTLTKYSKDEDESLDNTVWYSLGIGTIIAIIILVLISITIKNKK